MVTGRRLPLHNRLSLHVSLFDYQHRRSYPIMVVNENIQYAAPAPMPNIPKAQTSYEEEVYNTFRYSVVPTDVYCLFRFLFSVRLAVASAAAAFNTIERSNHAFEHSKLESHVSHFYGVLSSAAQELSRSFIQSSDQSVSKSIISCSPVELFGQKPEYNNV